jgi:hypothetical protein
MRSAPTTVLVLSLLAVVAGCGSEITLESGDGSRTLTYSCGDFSHQAERVEDMKILMHHAPKVMDKMIEREMIVSAESLTSAVQSNNFRRAEELIVEFKCSENR